MRGWMVLVLAGLGAAMSPVHQARADSGSVVEHDYPMDLICWQAGVMILLLNSVQKVSYEPGGITVQKTDGTSMNVNVLGHGADGVCLARPETTSFGSLGGMDFRR